MMGITPSAWEEAMHVMGPEVAAITVAAMLQRFDRITNPGGYLRAFSAKAATGGFSPGPMVMALFQGGACCRATLTAVNFSRVVRWQSLPYPANERSLP